MREIKQGYKLTDIGVIPEDWEVKQVGDIYDLICGFAFSGNDISNSGTHRLLRGINITEGEIRHNDDIDRFFNNDVSSLNKYFLEIGDLVIGMDGSKVGKNSALITQNDKGALLVQRVARLKSIGNKVSTSYLYLFINSLFFTKYVDGLKTNSAIPHISAKDIKSFLIPIPLTYAEQIVIATVLSDVDALIAALDKKITKKQQIKQGAMQQLLTGKKRLPGFRGENKFKQTEIGFIPEDWNMVSVGDITKFHKQGYYTKENYKENGEYYLLRGTDMQNPKIDLSSTPKINVSQYDYEAYKVLNGDFLFVRSGAIGRYGIADENTPKSIFGSYLINFRFIEDINAKYFGYFYESEISICQLYSIIQGGANLNINAENIKALKIPLPPLAEQIGIAQILTDMDNEISQLEADRNKYEQIKAGMMQQLLTGKIRLIS